eukprot:TRINITY_DN10109_c0_g1_i3.p1 TRINITY_DN10109_c0_g1~~TRINITY_DN10109_c0_g1_i3.p1  ORF type:complete len:365 (-),score=51.89 TRINITY_DN10109_c0_g1_i3:136-1146(-)
MFRFPLRSYRLFAVGVLSVVSAKLLSRQAVGVGEAETGRLRSTSAAAIDLETARLRGEAARVAGWLNRELGDRVKETGAEGAIRSHFATEAELLNATDPLSGRWLLDFAHHGPMSWTFPFPERLELGHEFPHLPAATNNRSGPPSGFMSSSSIDETETSTDAKGHFVKKTKTCKNGKCEEHAVMGQLPKSVPSGENERSKPDIVVMPRASEEMRRFGAEMRRAQENFGSDIFRDVFDRNFTQGQGFPADSEDLSEWNMSSPTGEQNGAQSTMTETILQNGYIIKRTTTCEDGDCETEVVNEALGPKSEPTETATRKANASATPVHGGRTESVKIRI